MAGGFVALLDDIAALARAAAASLDDVALAATKASSKAAGVVIDDAAVTPQYVSGLKPSRELPIIWRIARGSLINKLLIILPIALLLSQFLPGLLQPILMLGGAFLCFEGAEKVWEKVRGRHAEREAPVAAQSPKNEKQIVSGAVRTDLILSAEIMVIALNEVAAEQFWTRLAVLIVVGIGITALVYGAVALLVKLDDIGLAMTRGRSRAGARFGRGLVAAMPRVMDAISLIGTIAMLWVGGHLIVVGFDSLGFTAPYELIHRLAEPAALVPGAGAVLAWLVDTVCAMIVGFAIGSLVVGAVHLLPFGHGKKAGHGEEAADTVTGAEAGAEAGATTETEERKEQ
ncbi:DUF808 domain-containing protein [Gulosibacter sp. 10]|uniref:DUF808 domain-containing protein n=1 Tax=Gulosibacter sp. 10 TaxID=1255570 RepID=UPI00097F4579|nr:DUF808 domain-containing protein [Gulosibacter sp. 10]SJM56583.1 Membrane protein, putative [Gulosibacter sp. 10]